MKKATSLYLLCIVGLLTACIDDLDESHRVYGKLISEITGEGIENAQIVLQVKEFHGTGVFSYSNTLYEVTVDTDHLGNFTANIDYDNDFNIVGFYVVNNFSEEDVSTGIIGLRSNFFIHELKELDQVVFKARKLEDLEIRVKSIQPFNDEDKISISISEFNTTQTGGIVYDIINFQDPNEPGEFDGGQGFGQLYWIGDNVDSVIYGHLKEGTNYRINWAVTRNGVVQEFESDIFSTLSSELNFYEIRY